MTAPTVTAMRLKDGWSVERRTFGRSTHEVFVAPDGAQYVRARASEGVDLIGDLSGRYPSMAPVRLRRLEESSVARLGRKHERLVKRGQDKPQRVRRKQ
jgi:hypothetical protein